MTNSIGDQTRTTRKDVFDDYLMYYGTVWPQGNLKVCKERPVTERGRHVLSGNDPAERFTTFDFYQTASECVRHGARDCRSVFSLLIKAAEMLETLCVNLFMFPWKKEIRTLKTFTGPFVYCIKPVHSVAKGILESIGYYLESDTEYRLSKNVDPDKAKRMGFELFLARLECEYLLEVMGQRSHAECLEILQRRAAPLNHRSAGESAEGEPENRTHWVEEEEEVVVEEGLPDGCSLVDPGAAQTPAPPEALNRPQAEMHTHLTLEVQETLESPASTGRRQARSFMSEDRSILEMQKNYPDLAIGQKPIFRKRGGAARGPKTKGRMGSEGDAAPRSHTVIRDLSGPQSIAIHTGSSLSTCLTTAPQNPQLPEAVTEPQPPEDRASQASDELHRAAPPQEPGPTQGKEGTADNCKVAELTERMCGLHVKEPSTDGPLKYPIEETTRVQPCSNCHDNGTASPLGSPRETNQPIMCHPSLVPVCSIKGCGTCTGSDATLGYSAGEDTIKEPPHSIYIPPSPLSGCIPALNPTDDHQPAYPHGQHGNEGPSTELRRSPTQQPEDELLQTYVLVDP